jgi:hypothetical protein
MADAIARLFGGRRVVGAPGFRKELRFLCLDPQQRLNALPQRFVTLAGAGEPCIAFRTGGYLQRLVKEAAFEVCRSGIGVHGGGFQLIHAESPRALGQ